MNLKRYLIAFGIGAFYLVASSSSWAIPAQIFLNGQLLDKDGQPIHYWDTTYTPRVEIYVDLPAKIRLYDSATATTPFETITTTAKAYEGVFNMHFIPSAAAITKDGLWYRLSIDADRNGLTSSDDFPDLFEIGSVPFALSAKPQKYFTTFGGSLHGGAGYPYSKKLMVAPFQTPAGGVEFNQMNILVNWVTKNTTFAFGIYDDTGKLIIGSNLITVKDASLSNAFLQVKHQLVKLDASKTYYTGVGQNINTDGLTLPEGIKPVAPILGTVDISSSTGDIPVSFNPDNINPTPQTHALPITLMLVDETKLSKGDWISTKPGGSQYRWIIPKDSQKENVVFKGK